MLYIIYEKMFNLTQNRELQIKNTLRYSFYLRFTELKKSNNMVYCWGGAIGQSHTFWVRIQIDILLMKNTLIYLLIQPSDF